jgi:hypothetical protein
MRIQTCYSIALTTVAVTVCLAQEHPQRHVSVQPTEYGRTYGAFAVLEDIISHLDRTRLRAAQTGSWEERISNADKRSMLLTLNLNFQGFAMAGIYTVETSDGDTLVARWDGPAERQAKAIWLWDTPYHTAAILEVDRTLLQPEHLRDYCERLFLWTRDGMPVRSLDLTYADAQPGSERAVGQAYYPDTAKGRYYLWLTAMSMDGKSYVAVEIPKPMVSGEYPPDAYAVRERFPPLRSRLPEMPRHALFEELGKGYDQLSGRMYPTNRDTIILTELLSRGPLSYSELSQVIFGNPGTSRERYVAAVLDRMIAFLEAARRTKQLVPNVPALERICLESETQSPPWDAALGHVFRAVQDNDVDFTGIALALLKRDQFATGSLVYLEEKVHDEGTLRKLAEIPVRPLLESTKEIALGKIRARIDKERGGR